MEGKSQGQGGCVFLCISKHVFHVWLFLSGCLLEEQFPFLHFLLQDENQTAGIIYKSVH